jgi:hypothetical protein
METGYRFLAFHIMTTARRARRATSIASAKKRQEDTFVSLALFF